GVLVTPGVAGAAVLGSVLHQPGRPQPLPAFTVTVAGLGPQTSAALRALQDSTVSHTALTATLDLSTVDRFLAEMGEPVPDLGTYLLWTVARELSGGVDTLVDSTMGSAVARERVADRMLSHFGVTVHAPLRGAKIDEQVLTDIVDRTLPPVAARQAL